VSPSRGQHLKKTKKEKMRAQTPARAAKAREGHTYGFTRVFNKKKGSAKTQKCKAQTL
jgi:hypothetical protein